MLNIGWFSTGRDSAAIQLLQTTYKRISDGTINGRIVFVFSNREHGESKESDAFFNIVENFHIPLIYYSSNKFLERAANTSLRKQLFYAQYRIEYDRVVMKMLQDYNPDICVLAGYMLIVVEEMCNSYKMINLHPALPGGPTGNWQEVIWKLIRDQADISDVMMHLVTPELVRGPIIKYCTYPVKGKLFYKY